MTTSAAIEIAVLDAVGNAELVRRGEVTAAELMRWAIERIEALNPTLNAVITPMYEQALAAAAARPSTGAPRRGALTCQGPHHRGGGRPASREGSRFLRGLVSTLDSELVLRLRRAGLVIVGKTNTPEFGMAPTCEPVLSRSHPQPMGHARSTSGSSGGSAAAVASGMVPIAHGNDLGGSLRYPPRRAACSASNRPAPATRSGPSTATWSTAGPASTRSPARSATAPPLLDATAGPALG